MACFEDLNIDLLTRIFNYLTFTEIFLAFFGLKKRLNDIIREHPMSIDLSKIKNYHYVEHFSYRCQSLMLSGVDLHSFEMIYSCLNFTTLRNIIFNKMNAATLFSYIEHLPIQQLESITIEHFTWHYYPIDFYKQVWSRIMTLIDGTCILSLNLPYHIRYWTIEKPSYDFSALKYVRLEYLSVSQLLKFITYSPNLCRLKVCLDGPHKDLFRYVIILTKLRHLTLNLHDEWSVEEIQQLLNISPYLKYLSLKLIARPDMKIMYEPTTWQALIENQLSYVKLLQLHLNPIVVYSNMERYEFQEKFNHAEYWHQRKPHFQVKVGKF